MANDPDQSTGRVYQTPTPVVAAFYVLLLGWSVICVSLIESILEEWGSSGVFPLFVIGFILCYMWYFSLAVFYRMEIGNDGNIRLKSLRRTIRIHAGGISVVEFPRLGLGFIRFRLQREKAYLLCLTINESLRKILSVIRDANPDINFKNL